MGPRKKKITNKDEDSSEDFVIIVKEESDETTDVVNSINREESDETTDVVNSINNEESDETTDLNESSEEESDASSGEEMFIDGLDYFLDRNLSNDDSSSDEHCSPKANPQKRKRSGPSSISASQAESLKSSSPAPAKSGKGKDKRSSITRPLPFSKSISDGKWHGVDEPDIEPPKPMFTPRRTPGPQLISTTSYSPLQLFEFFFSTSVMQTIVRNSNAYGAKCQDGKKPWQNFSMKDFRSYLALVIYMGLLKCSSSIDYWKKSEIYSLPFPAQIMSGKKFLTISRAFHISDPNEDEENDKKKGTPEYDCLFQIKPLYQHIREACKAYFHPFQNISIDERMVASKAKNTLQYFMKNEPKRWGYKLFVLADSLCGYTWDFFVYEGKPNPEQTKGIGYDSVMALVNEKLLGTGYKLFVNSSHISPILFRDLLSKKIWACGTVRTNRIGHSKKPAPRGNKRWFRDDSLLFVEWTDKNDVLMCSTFHKAYNGDTAKRRVKGKDGVWTTEDFPVPAAVLDYNKNMGGVDLSDKLIGNYTVLHKTRKWYQSFFYHFVDIAVVNAFILHRHMAKVKNLQPLTQKKFREALVSELTGTSISHTSAQDPKQSLPQELHLPKHICGDSTIGRRKCKMCHYKTPLVCATCNVGLCFVPKRECFKKWHESVCGIKDTNLR
ncbi:piggyBac transposable element-derived protein 4 isoform X1 [Xyrauchen texanus]|uniref:piggyBac transposable element-derived protein 4 isoform X1 n=1 Tax=Xyrauchen texanus TaxID=154827 RepID=UPI00224191DA|nr:piggyBac transposable element-derived protein 4 isoform X1 [Xyrauchen texanus]